MDQLRLYEKMQCTLTGNSNFHTTFKARKLAKERRERRKFDAQPIILPSISTENHSSVFACTSCNQHLFTQSNVLAHTPPSWSGSKICKQCFVEPMDWMGNIVPMDNGNLKCHGCQKILGEFSWWLTPCVECTGKLTPAFRIYTENVAEKTL